MKENITRLQRKQNQENKIALIFSPMEEMMMVMMKIRSNETSPKTSTAHHPNINSITTCPKWKLYENPFYISPQNHQLKEFNDQKQIQRIHLPISARKIAVSFWDFTFIKPLMECELEMARDQIDELKAELECEIKTRKEMESLNKTLVRELTRERKGTAALQRVCKEFARQISHDKAEMRRMKKEMEDERKRLRMAGIIREERLLLKLAEAKILLEEKFEAKKEEKTHRENISHRTDSVGEIENIHSMDIMNLLQRRASQETENPRIKRGIKGFDEFPKMIRAIGCRSCKHYSSCQMECQKAMLKILLKHEDSLKFNSLIES